MSNQHSTDPEQIEAQASADHERRIEEAERGVIKYTQYRRTQIAEMADWFPGFEMAGVSISEPDRNNGSPKPGDKIARNPKNHADRWLVAAAYFADNFEPLNALTTSVESRPEKVDKWEGWDAFERRDKLWQVLMALIVVSPRQKQFTRWTNAVNHKPWHEESTGCPVDQNQIKLHGPARLEVLKSLPDDLVKAAKGVKS